MNPRAVDLGRIFRVHTHLRTRDLELAGIGRVQIARLVQQGKLERVARGLYALPEREVGSREAMSIVASRAPRAFFCLLTALEFHGVTTQAPFELWIGIGNKDRVPKLDWPPLRVTRYTGDLLVEGIEEYRADGVPVRVTDVARTVADCFKFRSKVGLDVALEALREVRQRKLASADDIWRMATVARVARVMRPYLEALG